MPPALGDPAHRIAQRGPAVRHVAGLAFGEVAAKHLVGVAAHAALDQVAREMRARDQLRVADVPERAVEGTLDADLGQPGRHLASAHIAAAARGRQALAQTRVVGVEADAKSNWAAARAAPLPNTWTPCARCTRTVRRCSCRCLAAGPHRGRPVRPAAPVAALGRRPGAAAARQPAAREPAAGPDRTRADARRARPARAAPTIGVAGRSRFVGRSANFSIRRRSRLVGRPFRRSAGSVPQRRRSMSRWRSARLASLSS